ncbi:MAG: hypothetical protein ACI4S4_01455 [Candidatus Ornithospirochaeta sp.]
MNRRIKGAGTFLNFLGYVNVSLIVLSISFTLVNIFPERDGALHFYNSFGVLPLLWALKFLSEKAKGRWTKVAVLLSVFLAVPLSSGNVAATAWTVSLLVFMVPALFAPKTDGRAMMTRPKVWHGLVSAVTYGLGNIAGVRSVSVFSVITLYIFLLVFALDKNITGCIKRIRDGGENVDASAVIKANGKTILLYVVLFSLLAVFLPSVITLLSTEREKSSVVYEFWEEGETKERETGYVPERKEKGLTRESRGIDYSGVGNVLLVLFLIAISIAVLLEVWVVIKRIMDGGGRRQIHRDQYGSEFSTEKIKDKEEKKKNDAPFFSTESRIRRLYRKAVEGRRNGKDISTLTPGEIEKTYLKSPSAPMMTEIYSRTRYSSRPASVADLDAMRAAARDEKSSK